MTNERKNITQPADWWSAFEEAAKAEGLTLSAWVGQACVFQLPASKRLLSNFYCQIQYDANKGPRDGME